MIIVTGSIRTSPENHDRLLFLSLEHVARSRAEPGCIAHNVHIDCENPNRLVFLEYWSDAPALKAHFAVPASRDFIHQVRQLTSDPVDMSIYNSHPWPAL